MKHFYSLEGKLNSSLLLFFSLFKLQFLFLEKCNRIVCRIKRYMVNYTLKYNTQLDFTPNAKLFVFKVCVGVSLFFLTYLINF